MHDKIIYASCGKYAVDESILEANTNRWSISCTNLLWKRVCMPHSKVKYSGKNRSINVAWKIMYDNMVKKKAFTSSA